MSSSRRFLQFRSRWYVLVNRHTHTAGSDAVVLRPMAPHDVERYLTMKEHGFVDAAIFAQLYQTPLEPAPVLDIVVPVTLLDKMQLAYLIEHRLGASMPSLTHMDKEDMVRLLGRL